MARALGADPPVLLMDEPFGAVDPVTRQRLQNQFLELQTELKKSIVFVTHDIEEAAKLGDRIAVLSKGGVLEQYDTPAEILGRPATPFVADFVGADRGVRRLAVVSDRARGPGPAACGVARRRPWTRPGRVGGDSRRQDWRWWSTTTVDLVGWVVARAGPDGPVVGLTSRSSPRRFPLGTYAASRAGRDAPARRALDPVVDDGDRYLGVLTPNRLHAAMRRSVGGHPVEP